MSNSSDFRHQKTLETIVRSPLAGSLGVSKKPVQIRLPHLASLLSADTSTLRLSSIDHREASTLGWDTAFAINVDDANKVIQQSGISPKTFSITVSDGYQASGLFGTWQIAMGGDGSNIHLEIPIPTSKLSFQRQTYSYDNATATVEIKLRYLPQDNVKGNAGSGMMQNLVVRSASADPTDPVASVLAIRLESGTSDPMLQALMTGALDTWFNNNLHEFSHVFAVVDINRIVDHQQFQWLAPTYTSYAYIDGSNMQNSYLGVLCMTGGRSAAGLVNQLSPFAVPQSSRSGFLISQERFLSQMVLPSLPNVFPNSLASDFQMADDQSHVINVNSVDTKSVEHGGITYHPKVQKLQISIVEEELIIYTLTVIEISLGINAFVENTSYMKLQLANKPDGTQTVTYTQSRSPVTNNWTQVAEGITITEIIIEIIGIVVMAILTVLTDGAALVVALIIVAIIAGLAAATPELIASILAKDVGNDVPPIDLLVINATDPIRWTGGKAFQITWAGLNGVFQMGGNPDFA